MMKRKMSSNPEVLGSSRSWSPAQAAPAVLSLRCSAAPNILSLAKDIDHGEDAVEPDEHDEAQPGTQQECLQQLVPALLQLRSAKKSA